MASLLIQYVIHYDGDNYLEAISESFFKIIQYPLDKIKDITGCLYNNQTLMMLNANRYNFL